MCLDSGNNNDGSLCVQTQVKITVAHIRVCLDSGKNNSGSVCLDSGKNNGGSVCVKTRVKITVAQCVSRLRSK